MARRVYSNVSPTAVPATSLPRLRERPYVSQGSQSMLTEKEREARRISRTASMGSVGFNTAMATQGNWYSPQLSTDFLEQPQSLREKREWYRHFYNNDELVGQAIDLHTELPLSKVRLSPPKPRTCPPGFDDPHDYGKYILSRFKRMCKKIRLFPKLIEMVHHLWLDGNAVPFAEDGTVEVPMHIGHSLQKRTRSVLHPNGKTEEVSDDVWVPKPNCEELEYQYYSAHYAGWSRLTVLTIDRVEVTSYSFTDRVKLALIPSDSDRKLVSLAQQEDPFALDVLQSMPAEVREHLEYGGAIPLGVDPDEGSFAYLLAGRKGADEELGHSILDRCLRNLSYRDKLRQAQTSIASRAMTPKRLVWAENLSAADVDELRAQIDYALVDPDFSIVTNYEVHWEDIGSRDRLLDLSSEYEQTDRRLITGLGTTESLMSGEALFSGDRVKLEVINQRYMFLREALQEYVETMLFEPVARRMGFVEKDKWGQEVVLYPKLSFSRLPLRDSQDTFDAMFNLYTKGSLSIDYILEILNIDPEDTRAKLEEDMFTVNDATFNEVLRGVYSEVGRALVEKTDAPERIANYLKLKMTPQGDSESDGRF